MVDDESIVRNCEAPVGTACPLYQVGDALWLLPALNTRLVKIAAPLFPPSTWPTYCGQVDWAQQFAWSAAR